MPNRNSHAGHIPERSCVICRQKKRKRELLRFVDIDRNIVFDCNQIINKRGYYLCWNRDCILKIEKWFRKKKKKVKK